jgi:hypothetical protein
MSQRKYIKDKVSFRIQKMRQIGSDLRSEVHTPHLTEERIDGLRESFQPLRVQSEGKKTCQHNLLNGLDETAE